MSKNNTKKKKSDSVSDKKISITDDVMINDALINIGKKTRNPDNKILVNNFINKTKTNKSKVKKDTSNNSDDNEDNDNNQSKKDTYTSKLSKEEIHEKLQDYKKVEDISTVPLNTHLRYFVLKDGELVFRMGGNLKRNLDLPNYIVLKNALGAEWTVQVKDTIFYKKMTIPEIKQEYDIIVDQLNDKIKKLKQKIKDLQNK
jgi:hypothetical protein